MRVEVTVGLEGLEAELGRLPGVIDVAARAALMLPSMVAAAKSFCPVDTGALMASIRAEARGALSASLVAGGRGHVNPRTRRIVDYAGAVHEGTSRMPARPFLLQAVFSERIRFAHEVFTRTAEAL